MSIGSNLRNIGNPIHIQSGWEKTSIFGARQRIEIDVSNSGEHVVKLVTQSAFSHFAESLARLIPFEPLKLRLKETLGKHTSELLFNVTVDLNKVSPATQVFSRMLKDQKQPASLDNDILALRIILEKTSAVEIGNSLINYFKDLLAAAQPQPPSTSSLALQVALDAVETFSSTSLKESPRPPSTTEPSTPKADILHPQPPRSSLEDTPTPSVSTKDKETPALPPQAIVPPSDAETRPEASKIDVPHERPFNDIKDPEHVDLSYLVKPDIEEEEPLPIEEDEKGPQNQPKPLAPLIETEDKSKRPHIDEAEGSQLAEHEPTPPPSTVEETLAKPDAALSSAEGHEGVPKAPILGEPAKTLPTEKGVEKSLPKMTPEDLLAEGIEASKFIQEAIRRIEANCKKGIEAIKGQREQLELLKFQFPGKSLKTIENELYRIEESLNTRMGSFKITRFGFKRNIPLVNLTLGQLADHEKDIEVEVRRIERKMAADPYGIDRALKSLNKHRTTNNRIEGYIQELRDMVEASGSRTDDRILRVIINLDTSLVFAKKKLSIDLASMRNTLSLRGFSELVKQQRASLEKEFAQAKHIHDTAIFLAQVAEENDNAVNLRSNKEKFINGVKSNVKDLTDRMDSFIANAKQNELLSDKLFNELSEMVNDTKRALEVFNQTTYPFIEGWLPFGKRVVDGVLLEQSGERLALYRQEALRAIEAADNRLITYQKAIDKTTKARSLFKEHMKSAYTLLNAPDRTKSPLFETLRSIVNENSPLLDDGKKFNSTKEMLDEAAVLGQATGKLMEALGKINEIKALDPAERLAAGHKVDHIADIQKIIVQTANYIHQAERKVDAYSQLLQDPVLINQLSQKAREQIAREITKFSNNTLQIQNASTPEKLVELHQAAKNWSVFVASVLEEKFHLFALKKSLQEYQAAVDKAEKWVSPDKPAGSALPLQLRKCLTEQQQSQEVNLSRITGRNSIPAAMEQLGVSTAAIENALLLVNAIWHEAKNEVDSYIHKLNAAKSDLVKSTHPPLDPSLKTDYLDLINKKIAEAQPYLEGLPRKGFFSSAVPFDKMDGTTLQAYRAVVASMLLNGLGEIKAANPVSHIENANLIFGQMVETAKQNIKDLEARGNYDLAGQLQHALNNAVEKQRILSETPVDKITFKTYCEEIGLEIGKIIALMERLQNSIPDTPGNLVEQMLTLEQMTGDDSFRLPQYFHLRIEQLKYTTQLIQEGLAAVKQKIKKAVDPQNIKNLKEAEAKLIEYSRTYTPAREEKNLTGEPERQAIPLDRLDGTEIAEYTDAVQELHEKLARPAS